MMTLGRPTAVNPHPFTKRLIQSTAGIWKQYVEHDFVKQLAQGTLPREKFIHFIKYAPSVPFLLSILDPF